MNAHTVQELQTRQALPLKLKVALTKTRIRDWVDWHGESGVYISFSGGKDSTVLLDLVRKEYPNVKAVFVDTGLEYPEVREFVRTFDNVDWIKPKKTFRQVIHDSGYPFIGKEVAQRVYYAQKYLTWVRQWDSTDRPTDRPSPQGLLDLCGVERHSDEWNKAIQSKIVPNEILKKYEVSEKIGGNKISGTLKYDGDKTQFDYRRWRWVAECPYLLGHGCCNVMKKSPVHSYEKETGRVGITGQMASESKLRTLQWLKNGCNAFNAKHKISNPMSFWTEQDVLHYIYKNKLPIASVYGDVVIDNRDTNQLDGQMSFCDVETWENAGLFDLEVPTFKTTGCKRTGCMFCGFGAHLEKPGDGRFERLKVTHPKQYEYIMRPWEEGGLGFKRVIDWLNENGGLDIRY